MFVRPPTILERSLERARKREFLGSRHTSHTDANNKLAIDNLVKRLAFL